jgi:hypothetical protein
MNVTVSIDAMQLDRMPDELNDKWTLLDVHFIALDYDAFTDWRRDPTLYAWIGTYSGDDHELGSLLAVLWTSISEGWWVAVEQSLEKLAEFLRVKHGVEVQ